MPGTSLLARLRNTRHLHVFTDCPDRGCRRSTCTCTCTCMCTCACTTSEHVQCELVQAALQQSQRRKRNRHVVNHPGSHMSTCRTCRWMHGHVHVLRACTEYSVSLFRLLQGLYVQARGATDSSSPWYRRNSPAAELRWKKISCAWRSLHVSIASVVCHGACSLSCGV